MKIWKNRGKQLANTSKSKITLFDQQAVEKSRFVGQEDFKTGRILPVTDGTPCFPSWLAYFLFSFCIALPLYKNKGPKM
jgi:hypothetical protein